MVLLQPIHRSPNYQADATPVEGGIGMAMYYIYSMLPNCRLRTPHECNEAQKIDKIAYLIAIGRIPKDALFVHFEKFSESIKIATENPDVVLILDESKL